MRNSFDVDNIFQEGEIEAMSFYKLLIVAQNNDIHIRQDNPFDNLLYIS